MGAIQLGNIAETMTAQYETINGESIIESEVYKFCELHHVLDFKMKTYWPQLRTQIEDGFMLSFMIYRIRRKTTSFSSWI